MLFCFSFSFENIKKKLFVYNRNSAIAILPPCIHVVNEENVDWTAFRMQQFNSKEDYNIILNNLKKEFEARWSKQEPSPYTNLEGYVQRAVIGNGSFGTVVS